jgi:biopolymer transport protein ExbD
MILQNRQRRTVPMLNTSSLPDLIFTVLFFFMVATHMRTVMLKVKFTVPQGTETTRLTRKSAVTYIYIGRKDGTYCVQLNDKIVPTSAVAGFLAAEKQRMSDEDKQRMTVSVKADRNAPMQLVTEVKMALRRANVRKISYSAEKADKQNAKKMT